jgi:hypothetical protein
VGSICWKPVVRLLALVGAGIVAASSPAQADAGGARQRDRLSEMFAWWNEAMASPGGFTEEAFSVWFTDDAPLVIDGVEVMRGPAGWAQRFQMIQAQTDAVEIVLPFRYSFQQGDRIYTYHVIRSRAQGKVSCMLAAGHADLVAGKISAVTLVRAEIDPASDPDCWRG